MKRFILLALLCLPLVAGAQFEERIEKHNRWLAQHSPRTYDSTRVAVMSKPIHAITTNTADAYIVDRVWRISSPKWNPKWDKRPLSQADYDSLQAYLSWAYDQRHEQNQIIPVDRLSRLEARLDSLELKWARAHVVVVDTVYPDSIGGGLHRHYSISFDPEEK